MRNLSIFSGMIALYSILILGVQGQTTYILDDNGSSTSLGRGGDGDLWCANQFDVIAGGEHITELSFISGGSANLTDLAVTFSLYNDPNDDGVPDDLVLITTASTTISGPNTETSVTIAPSAVSGQFYVGVSYEDPVGQNYFPFAFDQSSNSDQAWYTENSAGGTLDLSSLAPLPTTISSVGFPGQLMIRAEGIFIPEPTTLAIQCEPANQVRITVSNLTLGATNTLQRSHDIMGTNAWQDVISFISSTTSTDLYETVSSSWESVCWRIKSE